jgi:hypothetical protein
VGTIKEEYKNALVDKHLKTREGRQKLATVLATSMDFVRMSASHSEPVSLSRQIQGPSKRLLRNGMRVLGILTFEGEPVPVELIQAMKTLKESLGVDTEEKSLWLDDFEL